MVKRVLSFSLLLILFAVFPARAQGTLQLAEVSVNLWPEFDRPTMLVIYHITLASGTSLPADVGLSIPARAGAPNAVATRQPDGSLLNAIFTSQVQGAWLRLSIQATTLELQVEYYDPGLEKEGKNRHFTYEWPGGYAVSKFLIEVQQPMGATNLRFSPSLGAGRQDQNGLVYYNQDIGALAEGQAFKVTLDYEKADDTLTSNQVGIEPSGSLGEDAASWQNIQSILPWILGLVGVGLIVGGGIWYWQTGRQKASPTPRRRRRKPVDEAADSETVGTVYCHQCGKRASPGDRYCRLCGTQLRLG